jgi:hypothetical protein
MGALIILYDHVERFCPRCHSNKIKTESRWYTAGAIVNGKIKKKYWLVCDLTETCECCGLNITEYEKEQTDARKVNQEPIKNPL